MLPGRRVDLRQAATPGMHAFVTRPILRNEIAGTARKVLVERKKRPFVGHQIAAKSWTAPCCDLM
jgi:hypothetical protein